MLLFLFSSCIPGWPPTHCGAEDGLELWIFLPPLPKCWEFTGIHHHTQQDSISKNYKKGTNKLKNKQKNQTNQPTTLQRMVTPTFPRQLLEVEIPFYRKLYFSEQSKRRGQHTSCQPTWAPLSYQLWERLDSTPKSDVELVKAQDTPNCWQSSAMSTHAANRKGDGHRANIPKQSA